MVVDSRGGGKRVLVGDGGSDVYSSDVGETQPEDHRSNTTKHHREKTTQTPQGEHNTTTQGEHNTSNNGGIQHNCIWGTLRSE